LFLELKIIEASLTYKSTLLEIISASIISSKGVEIIFIKEVSTK